MQTKKLHKQELSQVPGWEDPFIFTCFVLTGPQDTRCASTALIIIKAPHFVNAGKAWVQQCVTVLAFSTLLVTCTFWLKSQAQNTGNIEEVAP